MAVIALVFLFPCVFGKENGIYAMRVLLLMGRDGNGSETNWVFTRV